MLDSTNQETTTMKDFRVNPGTPEPGQKVICVNGDFSNAPPMIRLLFEFPTCGRIYTIREAFEASLLLEEIVNPVVTWRKSNGITGEISFDIPRFRIATDFEIERANLIPWRPKTQIYFGVT